MEAKFNLIFLIDIPSDQQLVPGWSQKVLVTGETELPYSRPFYARFGTERLEGMALDIHGTGFTGYLKKRPAEGAKLFVEFEGEDPIDTGLVYSSTSGPNA